MFGHTKFTRFVFSLRLFLILGAVALALTAVAYNRYSVAAQNRNPRAASDGPDTREQPVPHERGNAAAGGIALPLLLDLARKPVFLHDNSVPTLDALFNPSRGMQAPHPFYFSNPAQRADMAEFLLSLDTDTSRMRSSAAKNDELNLSP